MGLKPCRCSEEDVSAPTLAGFDQDVSPDADDDTKMCHDSLPGSRGVFPDGVDPIVDQLRGVVRPDASYTTPAEKYRKLAAEAAEIQPGTQGEQLTDETEWEMPLDTAPYRAEITGVGHGGPGQSKSTQFIIRLTRLNQRSEASWMLCKRYSDFDALRAALTADRVQVPNFPRKHLIRSNTEAVITQRRDALTEFLNNVVLKHWEHPAVVEFLELHRASAEPDWVVLSHPFNPFAPFSQDSPSAAPRGASAGTDEDVKSKMLALAEDALRRAEEEQATRAYIQNPNPDNESHYTYLTHVDSQAKVMACEENDDAPATRRTTHGMTSRGCWV